VNNILKILFIFIFFTSCSFNKNSKFWSNEKIAEEINDNSEKIIQKQKSLDLEFNPNLKISLYSKTIKNSFINNYDNNNGRVDFPGTLENKSKFRYSKIDRFFEYNPEINFEGKNIIFFDNKGSILKFDENSKLIWKKNYYSKSEKKQNPILFFSNNGNKLIVADSISKFYALNVANGEMLWSKSNNAPFNSQVKIYKDYFFIIDFNNTLNAYSILNGEKLWSVKTEKALVRSQEKLSMIIVDEKIIFNNSIGDITAVDINLGQMIWQSPTQSNLIYDDTFFLKTSVIVADKNTIYLSNNKNSFFSLDLNTGILNWKQSINSILRPTLIDSYIFTVSENGYLFIIDKNSGNILRVTDIFKNVKYKKRKNIKPTGFIVANNNIYLTTDNGRLLLIDIETGKTKLTLKIDKEKILRPAVLNNSLFIAKENSIIKLN
jgi:outer membrane protein assembly factor BamB